VDVDPVPFRPSAVPRAGEEERTARAAYEGWIAQQVAARRRRRVELVTWSHRSEPGGLEELEGRVEALRGGLAGLGLGVERLEGERLATAIRGISGGRSPA
jgi:hypothetical protein